MGLFDSPVKIDAEGRMVPPSRAEVDAAFTGLIEGKLSREEIARWAGQWVAGDTSRDTDLAVWDALCCLAGADLTSTDRPYLYGEDDFRAWLHEFRERPHAPPKLNKYGS